jgi:PAS domain S-box-containing protein
MTHRSDIDIRQIGDRVPVVLYRALLTRQAEGSTAPEVEIAYVSAGCGDLVRCSPKDLMGPYSRWLEQVGPADRDILRQSLARFLAQPTTISLDYRLAKHFEVKEQPHLAPRWVRDTWTPLLDAEGKIEGWDGVVFDVTVEHQNQEELDRLSKMFEALLANVHAGVVFVQGDEGQPFLINHRARQLLGLKEDPLVGLDHLVARYHLHRADGALYPTNELPISMALKQNRTTMRNDIVVHRPDGQHVPLLMWAAPVDLIAEGRPNTAVWAIEDLTVMHQAEAARHSAETRLQAIAETLAEGVLVVNASGLITECNTPATKLFAQPAESLRRTWLFDSSWTFQYENGVSLPADDHPFSVALSQGEPVRNFSLGLQIKPTSMDPKLRQPVRWLLVNATPMFGPGENIEKVVLSFADVTEQKQAVDILRQSEEKYRGLLESLPVMVFVTNSEREVIYANPATKEITGYDLEEFRRPALWAALIHPDDRANVLAASLRSKAGEAVHLEMRYRAKNGSQKVGYCVAQPYWQNKRIQGNITLIMDVTRERKLEEELRHAQRMELVGRISSGVAHDFNNILTAVLTLTDFVKAQLPADHNAQKDLETLAGAGQQAAHLARQLLTFGKQQATEFQPVNVNHVIRRTLELLKTTWGLNIQVEAALNGSEPHIWGDPVQVQQILINLFLNSRDAMPEGGKLLVKTITRRGPRRQTEETPSTKTKDPARASVMWVVLSVEDTGKGMEESVQRRIFEPFFTTKEHGTGLGLAVVQQILVSHGGWVEVRSKPNQGTCFEILLPCLENGSSKTETRSQGQDQNVESEVRSQ